MVRMIEEASVVVTNGRFGRFEKWLAEKAKRVEKKMPVAVDYRDENYVSVDMCSE